MTKFKVGDKVRLIRKPTLQDIRTCYVKQMDVLEVGDIGDVLEIGRNTIFVKFNKIFGLWYAEDMLEHLKDKPWLSEDAWGDCYDWSKAEVNMLLEHKLKNGGIEYLKFDFYCPDYIDASSTIKQVIKRRAIHTVRPHFYADRKRLWKEKEYTLQELVGKEVVTKYNNKVNYLVEFRSNNGSFILTRPDINYVVSKERLEFDYYLADGSPIRIKKED